MKNDFNRRFTASIHDQARELIVAEKSMYSKTGGPWLFPHTCDFSHTLDPDLFSGLIRRRNQDFNSNINTDRWAGAAEYQRTVQRNVARKTALCVIVPVIPMKNDREPQFIAHCSPSFLAGFLGH